MGYVPGFQYDVFISYASDDYDDRMAQFVRDFRVSLKRGLGKLFDDQFIFFDREELNRTPLEWRRKLEQSAGSAAILVPMLSPSYATSDYCAKEWEWFRNETPIRWQTGREEVFRVCPVKWSDVDEETLTQVSADIRAAQQQRSASVDELVPKILNGLRLMRRSRQTVYLGETESDFRTKLRDEMSRIGFRVMPEGPQAYDDEVLIRQLLSDARLAVHFVGGQTEQRTIEAIKYSSQQDHLATVVYEVPGHDLADEHQMYLGWIEEDLKQTNCRDERSYDRVSRKNFDQFLQVVRDRLEGARPVAATRIGIACEPADRSAAESILPMIDARTGFSATCHGLDLLDFKKSRGVLFYWGQAEGKRLLQARLAAKGLSQAFFLAPTPQQAKREQELGQAKVLRQQTEHFTIEDIRPFLQELGWPG